MTTPDPTSAPGDPAGPADTDEGPAAPAGQSDSPQQAPEQQRADQQEPAGRTDDIEDEPETLPPVAVADRRRRDRTRRLDNLYSIRTHSRHAATTATGDIHNYYGPADPGTPNHGKLGLDEVRRLAGLDFRTPSLRACVDLLREGRIAVLHGRRDMARRVVAVTALDEVTAVDRRDSRVTLLPPDTDLSVPSIVGLGKGQGHLLVLRGSPAWLGSADPDLLGALRYQLASDEAFLLVLADRPPGNWAGDVSVAYEPPAPDLVLRSCLRQRLKREPDDVLDRAAADPEVSVWLARMTDTTDASDLADELAYWSGFTGESECAAAVAALARRRDDRLRAEAMALLSGSTDTGESYRRHAFLLAAAVLDGLPVGTVIDAAHGLAARLHARERPGDPLSLPVFTERMEGWLRHADVVDAEETLEDAGPRSGAGSRRVIRLHRSKLVGPLLEQVWYEFDAAREPLLDWLIELCYHPQEDVRGAAAAAVGKLATYDYEEIQSRAFARWASSGAVVGHWAAAWAMESIVRAGQEADRVITTLGWWARRGRLYQSSIAVRAFGTQIVREYADEALLGLRHIALHPHRALTQPLVQAIEEAFLHGLDRRVLDELEQWARHSAVRQLRAAACMARLADLPQPVQGSDSDDPDTTVRRPRLLVLAARDEELRARITALWLLILQHPHTRREAWRLLRLWSIAGDEYGELAETRTALLTAVEAEPELARPLAFHRRFWRYQANRRTEPRD